MARVTALEVKEIMDNCTVLDAIVDVFITSATNLISSVYANDISMSAAQLKDIEKWFTAHMLSCTVTRMAAKETVEGASIEYTGRWREGLDSTPYGQMVKILDISGKMGTVGKRAATIHAIKSFD